MKKITLEFGRYSHAKEEDGTSELGRAIAEARSRYDSLLSSLGGIGTEVLRVRILESDPDIYPYRYVRDAEHLFIFPPQDVEIIEAANSGEISGTRPYSLIREHSRANYDDSRVEAMIGMSYDDSNGRAEFRIREEKDGSVVPPGAETAIIEALGPLS